MEEKYETSDLWQTAFMICRGARLKKMLRDRLKPGRVVFVLVGDDLKRLAENFFQAGEVPALAYRDCALNLKHELYRYQRNNNGGRG
ncbi:hypothetical protein ES708_23478 [subsurface metagenome]